MKRIVLILTFLFILLITKESNAQISSTGKTFYMSFMEMETRNGGYPDTLLIFVTSEFDTKVTLDNPRLTGSSVVYNIKKGIVNRIAVDVNFYYPVGSEFGQSDVNSKKGLRLVAQDPINVYCMNLELNRSDGTFVLPYESIPSAPEYFVASFPPNAGTSGFPTPSKYAESEFVVVAMDNNVKVEITPAFRTKGGKTAGVPYTVTLSQKGQIYQVQSDPTDGTNNTDPAVTSWSTNGAKKGDLSGTRVRVIDGCGKINVFSGARSSFVSKGNCGTGVNGRDHLYTQVLPTKALGKNYVLMPFARQNGGYAFKVIAAYDTTLVYINGILSSTILKKGEWIYGDRNTAVAVNIRTSKPAYVAQYMKNGACNGWSGSNDGDPAIFLSPDVNQRLLKTTVGTATTSNMKNHWVNILVPRAAKSIVKLNGVTLATSNFTDVTTGFGQYSYAQMTVGNPSSNTISCDSGVVVVAYGTGPYESYTYSAGALFESVEYDAKIVRKGLCPSDPVKMVAQYKDKNVKAVKWEFGDGTPSEWGDSVTHKFEKIGTYYSVMKLVVKTDCGKDDTITRSKIISVKPGPILNFPDTITQCANSLKVDLVAPSSSKFLYVWNDSTRIRTKTITKDSKVWLKVTDTSTFCIAVDSSYVRRADTVTASISWDTAIQCYKENYFSLTDKSAFTKDAWKNSTWILNDILNLKTVTSTEKRFVYHFDSLSRNKLRYIVESQKGCKDTLDTALVVYPYPIAKLSIPDPYFCQNAKATLFDSSSSPLGVKTTFWSFGDGKKDTLINVRKAEHYYGLYDTFYIRMITETPYACRDTIDSLYVVHPTTKTEIGSKIVQQCLKQNEFEFYDNSTIPYGTFKDKWLIEGKTYDNQGTVKPIKFKDTGFQKIILMTVTDQGCKDTVDAKVYVAPEPKAIMKVIDSSLCFKGHYYTLECVSTVPDGSKLTDRSDWVFSDNTTAYAKVVPNKTFPQDGSFWVRLIAKTNFGCMDSVQRNVVVYKNPDASIIPDKAQLCFNGNKFHFVSKNPWKVSGVPATHTWDFGDGTNSTLDSFDKSYTTNGTFLIKHTVRTSQNCFDSMTTTATVVASPKADFTTNKDTACFYSQGFNFMDKTTFTGVYTVRWDFNDGTFDNNKNATGKSYSTVGRKLVKMLATTDKGCKDSLVKEIEVFAVPQSSFTINNTTQCLQNNLFIFSNTSNENGANAVTYNWGILGKTVVTHTGTNIPNQVMADTGTYRVGLLASSKEGCMNASEQSIYVAETPKVSILGKDACVGEEIQFNSALILNKGIPAYNWAFGDGSLSVVANPKHTYMAQGNFTVKLSVTSNFGCKGDANDYPVQAFEKPKASFTSEYLLSKGMETDWRFDFTGKGAQNYEWYFEDGQVDYVAGPIYKTFDRTGNFKVRLIASTANGCKDSTSALIFLKPELLMWIPNAFSPNVDGLNESFGPNMTFGLNKYSMKVFDRWGNILWQTENPEEKWKGIDKDGVQVIEGMYGYEIVFRYVDNKLYVYKGTVMVLY